MVTDQPVFLESSGHVHHSGFRIDCRMQNGQALKLEHSTCRIKTPKSLNNQHVINRVIGSCLSRDFRYPLLVASAGENECADRIDLALQ